MCRGLKGRKGILECLDRRGLAEPLVTRDHLDLQAPASLDRREIWDRREKSAPKGLKVHRVRRVRLVMHSSTATSPRVSLKR